ncbi:hypothetical protein [Acidianus brierleyi]|uniref:MFS transporter n=1 Tax=Acidianus brierleyi TaxID=41673 RepID=A0A2U9ID20_9CREN|nr:hypothetical protein [Acidianus brierleyi]AWR93906.1 hypothetical protein DFR85_04010 [Acidianus brierleyi]
MIAFFLISVFETFLFYKITILSLLLILFLTITLYIISSLDGIFLYLTYKDKLNEDGYVSLSQFREIRDLVSLGLVSLLSFLVEEYGIRVLSFLFFLGGIYYLISHTVLLRLNVQKNQKFSSMKLTREAFRKYMEIIKTNARYFYVVFISIFILIFTYGTDLFFFAIFKNSQYLYEFYAILNIMLILVSVTNSLFLNKIINIIKNKISNYFLFLLISLSLYLIVLPIILFKFPAYLFFIGYFITSIVQGASSAYIGSIFNTSIPSEYAGYLISIESLRELVSKLIVIIFLVGYVTQYIGIIQSSVIIIFVVSLSSIFFYFKTRKIK